MIDTKRKRKQSDPVQEVPGLQVSNEWISEIEEKGLLAYINEGDRWNGDSAVVNRRTIHYGAEYKYSTKFMGEAPAIPSWLQPIASRVQVECGFPKVDQIIVNEYIKGNAIGPHIDHTKWFGDLVATLTLGEAVPIRFELRGKVVNVPAPVRSLMVLSGDSRYKWKHSLKMDKEGTRVSVTFRTLK